MEFKKEIKDRLKHYGTRYVSDIDEQIIDTIIDQSIKFGKDQVSYNSIDECVFRINELAEKINCRAKVNIELVRN